MHRIKIFVEHFMKISNFLLYTFYVYIGANCWFVGLVDGMDTYNHTNETDWENRRSKRRHVCNIMSSTEYSF
jgi:uncharacterized protein involved in tellurium resistance